MILVTAARNGPFSRIQEAADVACAGDVVMVHEGTYRESVNPINGGGDRYTPITYTAAPGERPVIKGSEAVSGWQACGNSAWVTEIDNALFGDFNPFAVPMKGDWLERPSAWDMTLGEVYINGKSMYQAPDEESVQNPTVRTTGFGPDWVKETEPVAHPEDTVYQWYAQVGDRATRIWANFQEFDPNTNLVEINVRPTCFYPEHTGVDYITVTGFEMAQAACQWAPPTGDQQGLIGTHWSKGWGSSRATTCMMPGAARSLWARTGRPVTVNRPDGDTSPDTRRNWRLFSALAMPGGTWRPSVDILFAITTSTIAVRMGL